MAYQTGTATGPTDLLSKLRTFLVTTLGWTENDYSSDGTGYRLHVQHTPETGEMTQYWNFRSAVEEQGSTITEDNYDYQDYGEVTGILINGSTGYNAGNGWDDQPGHCESPDSGAGYSGAMCVVEMSQSAIPAYYFFAIGDSVHVVVETISGTFQFMSFGLLLKQGVYTGGQYCSASYQSRQPHYQYYSGSYVPNYFSCCYSGYNKGYLYLDVDGTASWRTSEGAADEDLHWPCTTSTPYSTGGATKVGLCSNFWDKSPNFYNNIASMAPIYTLGRRSDTNYSLLGWPEGVRFLNVTHYSAGQEITYGSETWKIFPENSIDDYDNRAVNKNCGFAFLKET